MEFKNKIIIITGGSQGFGKSLANLIAKEGAQVIISSDKEEDVKRTAKDLGVDFFPADVTSYEDLSKLGKYVFEKYGSIDVWINNAGIQIAPSLIEDVDLKKLKRLFDVNFFGYFYGCQIALKYMKKQAEGLIINVNSTAGLEGKPYISAYSASKFAIKSLTESIRKETIGTNLKIYSIYPGGMQTDIYKEKYPDDIKDYMLVESVTKKVIENLQLDNPEEDLIIKRPAAIK